MSKGMAAVIVIFICAKLFGVIDWSWWVTLSPFFVWLSIIFAALCYDAKRTWKKVSNK